MTLVKICGITNLNDARTAADLGADMLGLNFYRGSSRFIGTGRAKEIVDELGGTVDTIGVFVNEPVELVLEVVDEVGIKSIQLHGDETPEYVRQIVTSCGRRLIKAFRLSPGDDLEVLDEYEVDAVLLDGHTPGSYGGTGTITDWETARKAVSIHPKVFLAGGLCPSNVGEAIEQVGPYAVDVASGVESARGQKDPDKLREFIRKAKEA